ncbi:metalloregulator ArsR/SmtB family transcription factor [Acuticoccus sp. M5D2P5]|uniref:ArsR/SmtB family transcription factor n=1 Tax=Acuticoccus kalidii TaxID=2910977 RepID=UPI001F31B005|nr:metalloregulator ArsR/SmtB family transcription factor [Acuticoccus kalidii]MCF3933677.1 metalloregulator ArsR/SmtB family transcription factor [Acuticoccus kalidii]
MLGVVEQPATVGGHDKLVAILRAAGESTRLRILALLSDADLTVKDLTSILGQSQPRISRHLKLLADAGLVTRSAEGAWAFYRLAEDDHGYRLADIVLDHLDSADPTHTRDRERRAATHRANAEAAAGYFAANAEVWDHIRSLHAPEAEVEARMRAMLTDRPVRTLLDVGTGTGRILELLADQTERATGIDASAAMLSVARANLARAGITNARLMQDDVYALSLPRDSFDVVIFHQVLHYLDDPGRAVAEVARTLRPGGRLLVVDFAPHTLEALRSEAQHRRLGIGREEMAEWLRTANLETDEVCDLTGTDSELTVTLWLAHDPRINSDETRHKEGAFA